MLVEAAVMHAKEALGQFAYAQLCAGVSCLVEARLDES